MTSSTIDLARLRRAPRASVRKARTVATRVARRTRRDHPGVARLAVRGQERARAVRARVRPHPPERPLERVVFALAQALPDATFVQVGAHDGTQLDPLREAILGSRWRGVMVEPVPYVFDRLALRYGDHPRLSLENVAIADADGTRPFHLLRQADHDDEEVWRWYDALGSFRREVVLSHAHLVPDIAERIETIEVPCVTFATLCERNGLDHVDVVQIDTEGYDRQVLELIDVPRLRPRLVLYEHLHLDRADRDGAEDLMTGHGFRLVSDGMDTLAVDDRALAHPEVAAAFESARLALATPPPEPVTGSDGSPSDPITGSPGGGS
jgi:FkbM family methyltransferase